MRTILLIFSILFQFPLSGQDFIAQLYFEDSAGSRDTLTFGRVDGATLSLDEEFGELDIKNDSLDNFDVRFYRIQGSNPNMEFEIFWDCNYISGSELRSSDNTFFETKTMFNNARECDDSPFGVFREQFFIPALANFPITVSWDSNLFQDSCSLNANISEVPFFEQNGSFAFCPERINLSFISLRDSNSIILTEPNFLSYNRVREDTNLVASYYLTLPHAFDGNITINTSKILESNVIIFPNPTQDKLYLDIPDQKWQYQIINLQGQQMMQGKYQDYIQVETLPSGIYFLQLEQDGSYYKAIKFVKE